MQQGEKRRRNSSEILPWDIDWETLAAWFPSQVSNMTKEQFNDPTWEGPVSVSHEHLQIVTV